MVMYDLRCCEMCKMLSDCVRLRQSGHNLCESFERSLTGSQRNIKGETQSEMAHAIMVPRSLSEENGGAIASMTIEPDEYSHHELDDNVVCEDVSDILIKNLSDTTELCKKSERKLVSGVRCTRCKNGLHWNCAGISKDSVKSEVIANKDLSCVFCRNSSKNCMACGCMAILIIWRCQHPLKFSYRMMHITFFQKESIEIVSKFLYCLFVAQILRRIKLHMW